MSSTTDNKDSPTEEECNKVAYSYSTYDPRYWCLQTLMIPLFLVSLCTSSIDLSMPTKKSKLLKGLLVFFTFPSLATAYFLSRRVDDNNVFCFGHYKCVFTDKK